MQKNIGWKAHLKWLVPLILIPGSYYLLAFAIWKIDPDDEPSQVVSWVVLALILLAFVAPVVFTILTIVGAVKTYRQSDLYARSQRKKLDAQAQATADRIFKSGGPQCDRAAQLAEKERAAHWMETLLRNGRPQSGKSFNLNLEPGERIFHQFRAQYARYYGTNVSYQTGGTFAMGSPLFVIGAMIGTAIGNSSARANASRMAAEQWREIQFVDVFVTDRRLIIPVSGRTLSFYYRAAVAFYPELEAMTLTLDFGDQTEPLQIFSPAVSAVSVMLIHHLQGTAGLRENPSLNPVRQATELDYGPASDRALE